MEVLLSTYWSQPKSSSILEISISPAKSRHQRTYASVGLLVGKLNATTCTTVRKSRPTPWLALSCAAQKSHMRSRTICLGCFLIYILILRSSLMTYTLHFIHLHRPSRWSKFLSWHCWHRLLSPAVTGIQSTASIPRASKDVFTIRIRMILKTLQLG